MKYMSRIARDVAGVTRSTQSIRAQNGHLMEIWKARHLAHRCLWMAMNQIDDAIPISQMASGSFCKIAITNWLEKQWIFRIGPNGIRSPNKKPRWSLTNYSGKLTLFRPLFYHKARVINRGWYPRFSEAIRPARAFPTWISYKVKIARVVLRW